MLRLLTQGLVILHLGPGIAFMVYAFGCDTFDPALGDFCTAHPIANFAGLTLALWLALTVAAWLLSRALAAKSG